jgi:hypothetical protein
MESDEKERKVEESEVEIKRKQRERYRDRAQRLNNNQLQDYLVGLPRNLLTLDKAKINHIHLGAALGQAGPGQEHFCAVLPYVFHWPHKIQLQVEAFL